MMSSLVEWVKLVRLGDRWFIDQGVTVRDAEAQDRQYDVLLCGE